MALMIPFASFLAGAILSLVMPTLLLISIVIWFHVARKRMPAPPQETPRGSTPTKPPPGNPGQPDTPAAPR
jgi:hypothetical protein